MIPADFRIGDKVRLVSNDRRFALWNGRTGIVHAPWRLLGWWQVDFSTGAVVNRELIVCKASDLQKVTRW